LQYTYIDCIDMLKRRLYYMFSPSQRLLLRKIYYFPSIIQDKFTKKREVLLPPKAYIYTGRGDFEAMGKEYVEKLKRLTGLQAEHSILDIGCGIGRIAIPLTKFLNTTGRYEGFDVVQLGINWCKKHIETVYPNFHFRFIPILNDLYNLSATESAENIKFPYSNTFDRILLISVVTHMQADAVSQYLKEVQRLLKDDGFCFCTFFHITDEILQQQNNTFFPHHFDGYSLHNLKVKDANIGFHTSYLYKMIDDAGLEIVRQYDGWWSGKQKEVCEDFQDILIMQKKK
jgi:ubiquinone/menaquinone biosynthesis C-methylase UbiE